jgi:hypothetical protein
MTEPETDHTLQSLVPIFSPRNVAVIGASASPYSTTW